MTELELRKQYVQGIESYLGTVEGDENHRELIDWYNRLPILPRGYKMTYTADWCVAAPVGVAVKLGLTDIILPECSCTRAIALYTAAGRFVRGRDYVPQTGDFVVYDWQGNGDPDHWGTVVTVTGNNIRVIEGNMSDRVAYRDVQVGDSRIYGYCLPDYGAKADPIVFRDVPENAWYAESVDYCVRNGLMNGRGDGLFDPTAGVTRAELAAVAERLHRALSGRN